MSRATVCSADLRVPSCAEFLPRPAARLALKRSLKDLGEGGGKALGFGIANVHLSDSSQNNSCLIKQTLLPPFPLPPRCRRRLPALIHSQARFHVELNVLPGLSFHFYSQSISSNTKKEECLCLQHLHPYRQMHFRTAHHYLLEPNAPNAPESFSLEILLRTQLVVCVEC